MSNNSVSMPIKIVCASLNFQRLDTYAMESLSGAKLSNDLETISHFKEQAGFCMEQIAIIEKCNAVIIVFCFYGDFSSDFIRGRILSTWDSLSNGGIISSIRHIKFFENADAIKYLGECSVGIHSVTLGDSQVLSQICDALQFSADKQPNNPTFSILIAWLKNLSREIKLKTSLLAGNTSLERIATEIIKHEIKKNEAISLIGFGKSGKLITKILTKELGYYINIANRSTSALLEVADNKNVSIVDLTDYLKLLDSACIVFAIDSNDETKKYVKGCLNYLEKISTKPRLLIDLASPTLIESDFGVQQVINIENLSVEANNNVNKRTSEVNKARDIIDKSCADVIEGLKKEISKIALNKLKKEITCKLDEEKLNLFRIRNDGYKAIRNYLDKLDFVEVTTPYIVGISTDPPKVDKGGTIDVSWPSGSPAFLRQSNQLYKQMIVVSGLPKIYEIGPFWRAETIQSYRHLQESISLDVELSQPEKLEDIYDLAYSIIRDVKNRIEKIYNIKNEKLILPETELVPVITYSEAIGILNSKGYSISLGEDLGLVGEAKLGQIIRRERNSDVFIVRDYPDTIKKFYTKKKEGGLTETFDSIVSGWELVSGAIRETDRLSIEKSMHLSGIDTSNYSFYLSIVDGAIPHGGFGLGIDRLIAKVLDLEMVSDAVVFPRTFKTLIP